MLRKLRLRQKNGVLIKKMCILYWLFSNLNSGFGTNAISKFFLTRVCQGFSPQNSPPQLAMAEGFAEANSVFIEINLAKILQR